jgi:hypothetical protein
LTYDVTDAPIMFGAGGILKAGDLDVDGAGFGVEMSRAALERSSVLNSPVRAAGERPAQ